MNKRQRRKYEKRVGIKMYFTECMERVCDELEVPTNFRRSLIVTMNRGFYTSGKHRRKYAEPARSSVMNTRIQ